MYTVSKSENGPSTALSFGARFSLLSPWYEDIITRYRLINSFSTIGNGRDPNEWG